MMPRIEAGETLMAVGRAALTNNVGYESELDRQSAFEDVRRRAAGEPKPEPIMADPADLAGMGIGIANAEDLPTIVDFGAWLGNGEHADG